jgi:hypothetical protein
MQQSAIDHQSQIYLNGFNAEQPVIPIHHKPLEQAAQKCISKKAFAYIAVNIGQEFCGYLLHKILVGYKVISFFNCSKLFC